MLHSTKMNYSLTKYMYMKSIRRLTLVRNSIREAHTSASSKLHSSCIRQTFIDYFKNKHSHVFVPSSSTIPSNDETLLFTNAGMNQGRVSPDCSMSKYRRVVNSQKCVRAGGKHNDLDDVGLDCYHHTFFEMLGNWSFADYFKKDAVHMAWDLLTNVYGLPEDRLYVTYFEGDENSKLQPDVETKAIWQQLGVPDNRLLAFGSSDNFWEMGNTGPCGPCTEIHFDRLGNRDASALVNKDNPDVVELWNLVFTQYDRDVSGCLHKLPSHNVDTGMGLERLVSVLQGVTSNYDTDLFKPLILAIEQVSGVGPYEGKVGIADVNSVDMAYRVVADHARMLTMCITDGARPGPQMQGYVVKRIIRRAVRYIAEKLKAPPGTLASLVPIVIDSLGSAFPELQTDPELVMRVMNQEEQQFLKTLSKGKKYLQKHISKLGSQNTLSGEVAWKMYDSFGYPVDLTSIIANENNLKIDMEEYEQHRRRSKEVTSQGGIKNQQKNRKMALYDQDVEMLRKQKTPVTDISTVYSTNYNQQTKTYSSPDIKTQIIAIKTTNGFVTEVGQDVECGVITTSSNFYAEFGGQVSDIGVILTDKSCCLTVYDVQSYAGYVLHNGTSLSVLRVGDDVDLHVDWNHRTNVIRNHTATHLLNFALREVVKDSSQKGSLVACDKLRFDFSALEPLNLTELQMLSDSVNHQIQEALPLDTSCIPLDKAYTIPGLQAVFGEAYGDQVRVVAVGQKVNELIGSDYACQSSVELCGGTHVENTEQIQKFILTSQKASSSGVRRLEAVTGDIASQAERDGNRLKETLECIQNKISKFQNSPERLQGQCLLEELDFFAKSLDKTIACIILKTKLRQELLELKTGLNKNIKAFLKVQINEVASEIMQSIDSTSNRKYHIHHTNINLDKKHLMEAIKAVGNQRPNIALMLLSSDNERVSCCTLVPKELNQVGVWADEWGTAVNHLINGKGSGSESLSQFQGSKTTITKLILEAEHYIASKIN